MQVRRVAVTATAVLSHTFVVDETPTSSTTDVTVSIVDANGTAVLDGNGDAITGAAATAAGDDTGQYTYTLPSQSQLSILTVSWSATIAGAAVVEKDRVEVVGDHYFTLKEGRDSDKSLSDTSKYTTSDLMHARLETEIECEQICDGRAFVPRYARVVLDGTGTSELLLPDQDVRTIRAARVAPQFGQDYVDLTDTELSILSVTSDKILRRTDQSIWTEGDANVIVEYEFGLDTPPIPLKEQTLVRFRSLLNKHRTGIPDRAATFTSSDGGTYRLTLPGRYSTGIPEVDAVYQRYGAGAQSGTGNGPGVPASRRLDFDPQWLSMYHGGVR